MIQQCSSAGNNFSSFFLSNIPFGQTKPWRQPKMCWWDVQSSFPIIMRNQPDIFKIWLDTVQWLTVSSSTDVIKALHLCAFATGPISILICHSSHYVLLEDSCHLIQQKNTGISRTHKLTTKGTISLTSACTSSVGAELAVTA